MKNPEKLIGKKIKGFKFEESSHDFGFVKEMNDYIDKVGEIKSYIKEYDSFLVEFKYG